MLAHASVPTYKGSSANGEDVFFETDEQLVPGDTDNQRDVYERHYDSSVHSYVTREVSIGPTGGNDAYPAQYEGASKDGSRVFFSTREQLVAGDTDHSTDIYMRDLNTGTTTLVSQGEASCAPGCGNGEYPATYYGTNEAGTEVFFTTAERLSPLDTDNSTDLYVRNLITGTTTLVSQGEASCAPGCGNGEFPASPRGISADGSHAYFVTAEKLSSADKDEALDIYAYDLNTGTTSLVSTGECTPECGNSGAVPIFDGSSANGSRVFFSTDEKLSEEDHDTATDIYARDLPNGPTTLISGGSANTTVSFAAASADGNHVFFTTAEGLVPEDTNGANDIYEWTGGTIKLVTSAPCASACGATFDAVSADSTQVLFSTFAQLSPEDTDNSEDIYRQSVAGGSPVLVSRGESSCSSCWNGAFNASFDEASANTSRVIFGTAEGILAEDTDGEDDIYLRNLEAEPETTSLITTSPSYCPLKKGNCGATFVGASENGQHVFFSSVERFTLEDGDNEADIYERFLGSAPGEEVTRLVSTGNNPNLELGPPPPNLTGTSPETSGTATSLRVLGSAQPGSRVKLYTSSDCSGEPIETGTAAALSSPGLPVSVAAGSLTSFRATAEAEGFVSTCSGPVTYQQLSEGSGGAGGGGGGGGGSAGGSGGGSTPGGKPQEGGSSRPAPGPTYVAPHTRITFAPAAKTRSRDPIFRFTDSTGQQGTSFECKLDRQAWKRCGSPLRLKKLSRGRHVLEVKAINAVGTVETTPARRSFKVVPR